MTVRDNAGAEPVDLAERRAAVTRSAIADAVAALLEREHPATISVPDVAREAGVSVRTVYRYFPNKQALLDHVANLTFDDLGAQGGTDDQLYEEPARWIPQLWRLFGDQVPTLRAQQMSPAGADLRDRRLGRNRSGLRVFLSERHPGRAGDDIDKLADLLIAVTSSAMFLELHDRMGWPVDEAADLAVYMLDAIQTHFETGDLP